MYYMDCPLGILLFNLGHVVSSTSVIIILTIVYITPAFLPFIWSRYTGMAVFRPNNILKTFLVTGFCADMPDCCPPLLLTQ